MSLTEPTVSMYVMPIWHCFWSSECAMKKIRTARYGEAENQWKENLRLIVCVNTVNEMCVREVRNR
jgi:hypothetical protein